MMVQVDVSRIEAICKAKVKVNPDNVLDPEAPQGLAHVVRQLQQLQATSNLLPHPFLHSEPRKLSCTNPFSRGCWLAGIMSNAFSSTEEQGCKPEVTRGEFETFTCPGKTTYAL